MELTRGSITIASDIRGAMIAHAFDELPNEACGLLAGRDGVPERIYRMRNADDSPFTYRLDPNEQIRVFNQIEDDGLELTAIYHSHTHTHAYPSETDRRQAFYPDAYYILISLADRESPVIRGFTIRDDTIEEQEVRFE